MSSWGGVIHEKQPMSDYDKACTVADFVGLVESGAGSVLVLGDEPFPTAWKPAAEGGFLICWICADSHEEVEALLESSDLRADLRDTGLTFKTDGASVLFDASEPGDDIRAESSELELDAGSYQVLTGVLSPDSRTKLLVHELRRA